MGMRFGFAAGTMFGLAVTAVAALEGLVTGRVNWPVLVTAAAVTAGTAWRYARHVNRAGQ